MSRKPYQRKTGYRPQNERRLYLKVDYHDPVDMSALADVILMLALAHDDENGPELRGLAQQFPFARPPRQGA
ncbi:MAG: hypothetical protein LBE08_00795 [Bifidobacteriaceae bacterium]|jgi:hypothetical protein|nr:hypothetical protein [Bifidobacteriaceae bacterium]